MAFRQKWEGFENRMKAKREINCKRKQQATPKKVDHLTVQRLSSDVSGKAQKFSRIGPREFVSYPHGDLTIDNIKKACEAHFLSQLKMNVECDVLAGEQGPSCSTLDQIPNLKLIHIRFVGSAKRESSGFYSGCLADSELGRPKSKRAREQPELLSSSYPSPRARSVEVRSEGKENLNAHYPKSLSVTQMINLGKVVRQKTTIADVYKFNLENMAWSSVPERVELVIEKEPFAQGGFREVYKARSPTACYSERLWVVKKYLPKTLESINQLGQTIEDHTKKAVQMQSLAKNIADSMYAKVWETLVVGIIIIIIIPIFIIIIIIIGKGILSTLIWEVFTYTDIYMAKLEDGEYVTIEEFIDGDFTKYLNNTGLVCGNRSTDECKKSECLAHYSYEKSSEKLMLLDIQGSMYTLFDPEIASATLLIDAEYLFGVGNLTSEAISTFIENHECNKFCALLELKPFPVPSARDDKN